MSSLSQKDASIQLLVQRLREYLGARSFELPPAGEWADYPYTPADELSIETFEGLADLIRTRVMSSAA